jgi:glycosyltransferase involved in cell wall biosynthesis
MHRIRLIYDVPGWAYYRRCHGVAKHAPDDFQVDIGRGFPRIDESDWRGYDLILNLMPDQAALRAVLDRREESPVIVGGLNVGYGHHQERLRMCQSGADHIVVNNRYCWERLGKPEGMTWISNGVDRDIFRVKVPIEDRKPRVLWTGSNYHCHYTNIKGWTEVLRPLAHRLEAAGIDYDYRRVESDKPETCHSTEDMVDWYNTGTVYVCASSSEGTPNPALEAAACGCTVVSTPVGNMPELVRHCRNGLLTHRHADDMFDSIETAIEWREPLARNMQRTIAKWDWSLRAPQYYELFRRLIQDRR